MASAGVTLAGFVPSFQDHSSFNQRRIFSQSFSLLLFPIYCHCSCLSYSTLRAGTEHSEKSPTQNSDFSPLSLVVGRPLSFSSSPNKRTSGALCWHLCHVHGLYCLEPSPRDTEKKAWDTNGLFGGTSSSHLSFQPTISSFLSKFLPAH